MTSWVPFDLLDHLWQSTLFAAAVWLVAHVLRTNAARVRYWLWLAASLKFLVPISLLVSFGERFAWRTAAVTAPPAVSAVIEQVLTPAAATVATTSAGPIASSTTVWPLLLVAWSAGVLFVLWQWWRQWRPIRQALHGAHAIDAGLDQGLSVLASPSMIEPGVFGIWRPVLLVPEGIGDRLTPAQLRALMAHERCHIRNHDNLTAALHMVVEALFWFHPLVWWLEGRLIEERERACDEYVLQSGSTPRDYAEGILEVCRFATDPSPVFVAGITGSDLKRRIASILQERTGRPLGTTRAVALALCAMTGVVGPVTVGASQATTPAQAAAGGHPRFEVASIKRHNSSTPGQTLGSQGDRFIARNVTARDLIATAYDVPSDQVSGGPAWIDSEQYDVEAKPASPATWPDQLRMLQSLLVDRFRLQLQRESRDIPTYDLIVSPSGVKMKPAPACRDDEKCGGFRTAPGAALGRHVTVAQVARLLAGRAGRRVTDATGLQGYFDIELRWNPGPGQLAPAKPGPDDATPIDASGPSLSVAIEEQLGLRFRTSKGTADYFAIVNAERPSEN